MTEHIFYNFEKCVSAGKQCKVLNLNGEGKNNILHSDHITQLAKKTEIEELHLRENKIHYFDPNLPTLSNLRVLDLNKNRINPDFLTYISKLERLEKLDFSENRGLTTKGGAIPPQIGNLTELKEFRMDESNLIGTIPKEIGDLKNLEVLTLSKNHLSGRIPKELGQLENLETLYLHHNLLSEDLPKELGQLENLKKLSLAYNKLRGTIPKEFENLKNLSSLNLKKNTYLDTKTLPTRELRRLVSTI